MEREWQVVQHDLPDRSSKRTDRRNGVEDAGDLFQKSKKTTAFPYRTTINADNASRYRPKSHTWAEFAAHLAAEEDPRRRVHLSGTTPKVRFKQLLGKIEIANIQTSCRRLSEQWEEEDKEWEAKFRFETSLWVLVGLEKVCALAQSNYLKSGPNYCLDGPSMVKIQDGMDVLHLGPVHNSPGAWFLGAKHSLTTICSLATEPSSFSVPSSNWGWPSNVNSGFWDSCPTIPYPDNTFNVVFIQPIFHVLRRTEWPVLIKEAIRVLSLGNCLAIQVMDPIPKRAGPLLQAWVAQHLIPSLARKQMVSRPNIVLPGWLGEFTALSQTIVEAIEFPIGVSIASRNTTFERQDSPGSPPGTSRNASLHNPPNTIDENISAQVGRQEVRIYASLIGKHLYQSMYETFVPLEILQTLECGPQSQTSRWWWWDDSAILDECRRFDSAFELVTYFCRKKEACSSDEVELQ